MDADQINSLRETFRRAMLDWDVPISVVLEDDYANVSFELWGKSLSGTFDLENGIWQTLGDCPHSIDSLTSVWQWIAMQFHKQITT